MYRTMRLQLPLFLLTLMLGSAARAQEIDIDSGKLPREGRSLDDFTPRGWTAEMKANGDLNADGIADIAAILIQTPAKPDKDNLEESQRLLLVLISGPNGKLLPGGRNGELLGCVHCGGVKESAGVEIKKGVLIVSQLTGSREFTDQTWRYRYNAKIRRFVLIGRDVTNGDGAVGTGVKESYNFLTGIKISKHYRYDHKRDREVTISSKKEKISKQARFLEDAGME
ncbi:hypothetical protein [Methylomicrobium sp. Wu6]|uniref:hypothetical protein n=1 Tax=Methylomicrobium sp. Wu6 TaxID=3107928 RepID=UPI002DD61C92|nr:hypothetical protein [Methylomicrobium sp. Wu6]MEC4748215.1 hypothetical protein [Methylomicrobium sp. Wu6]